MRVLPSVLIVAALLVGSVALAQQPEATTSAAPVFEVATIKPTAPSITGWRLQATPDGYTGSDVSLLRLVGEAYGIFDAKLMTGGPAWADTDKFDLEAKFNAAEVPDAKDLTYRQRADMLRPLLAERFHLKVHWESREFPVYDLVVAKGGAKLTATKPGGVTQGVGGATCLFERSRRGYIQVQGCLPKDLEDQLRYATGRTVIDKTGITVRSDFELRWTPEDAPADAADVSGPSIFTAVQEQLGLKLVPATAPLQVLVIDSAEQPSAN